MVFLVEFVGNNMLNVVALPDGQLDELKLFFILNRNTKDGKDILSKKCCCVLDALFEKRSVLCWKSENDLEQFLMAAKKDIKFKIRPNSVILPQAVVQFLDQKGIATPTIFSDALRYGGLTKEEIYRSRT